MSLFGIILVWTALYSFLFYFTHLSLWFYFLWVPLSLILALLTLVLVIWILFIYMKRTDPKGKFRHHLLHQATELILWCLRIKVTAEGKENIPSEPFVCYANHKSDIDPVALYYQLHRICTAIGKKSLFSLPVIKQCQPVFGAVPLDRDNDREAAKAIITAIREIKDGMSMIVFPEGGIKSRQTEEMVDLKAGAYRLVTKSGALLLPATILGSSKIKTRKFLKKVHIHIIFHAPISKEVYDNHNTQEIGKMVFDLINHDIQTHEQN